MDEWDERDLDEGDDTRNGEGMYVGDPQGVPSEDPNVKYVQVIRIISDTVSHRIRLVNVS